MKTKLLIFSLFSHLLFCIELVSYFDETKKITKIEIPKGGFIQYSYDENGVLRHLKRHREESELLYEVFYHYNDHHVLIEEIINHDSKTTINKVEPFHNEKQQIEISSFPLTYEFNFKNELIHAYNQNLEIKIDYDEFSNRTRKEVISDSEKKIYYFGHVDGLEVALFDEAMNTIELMVPGVKVLPFLSKPSMIELEGEPFIPIIDEKFNIVKLIHLNTREEHLTETVDIDGFSLLLKKPKSLFSYRLKPFDPDLGLVYFGYRYYDPILKSFISDDPLGKIQSQNLKAYCNNKPEMFIDPDGRFFFVIPLISSDSFQEAIEKTLTTLITSLIYDITNGMNTWIDQYQDERRSNEFLKIQKGEKPFTPEPVFLDTSLSNDVLWQDF